MTSGRLTLGLVALNFVLIAAGALAVPPPTQKPGTGVHIGLVFDIGGKNDKSFNTAAYRGLLRVRDELGVAIEFIEPTEGNDRETALRSLAAKHVDLVIRDVACSSARSSRDASALERARGDHVDHAERDLARDRPRASNSLGARASASVRADTRGAGRV